MDFERLLGLVGTIFAPILPAVITFLKDRKERHVQTEIIKAATEQVIFWKLLSGTQATLLTGSELEHAQKIAVNHLASAAALVQSAQQVEKSSSSEVDARPKAALRRVLFIYKPPAVWLWLLRVYYYWLILAPPFTYRTYVKRMWPSMQLLVLAIPIAWVVFVWWLVRYTEKRVLASKVRRETKVASDA